MHHAPLIHDLALILGLAAVVTLIFNRIRQPVVLGYVVAGLLISPNTFRLHLVADLPNIQVWAELGVIFLMFSVGLEFSFRRLMRIGVSTSLSALIEVGLMMCFGWIAAKLAGWNFSDSIFLAILCAISSTTIIFKTLDELKLRSRRFAERIMSMLVMEDLVAILILASLSLFVTRGTLSGLELVASGGKLLFVVGTWFLLGYFAVPRFVRYVGRVGSDEMLTILSLGLCIFLAVVAARFGYSVALGAFIMGSIVAESSESHRIEELIRPLRDVFSAIFFVSVGILVDLRMSADHWIAILGVSCLVVFGKIFAATLSSLLTGQTFRSSVQIGFGLAQIGEFSFIIAGMGATMKLISPYLYPVAVTSSLLTTFLTPYLIRHSHTVAVYLEGKLPQSCSDFLLRYATWMQGRASDISTTRDFYRKCTKWVLNAGIITLIFLVTEDGIVQIDGYFPTLRFSPLMKWLIAFFASSPFFFGMMTSFKASDDGGRSWLAQFFFQTLSIFLLATLTRRFLPTGTTLIITLIFAVALIVAFYRRLEDSYTWFESTFKSTFNQQLKSKKKIDLLKHLAPWDAHLVRIKVHPNSTLAGKTLAQNKLRSDHGINIVAIHRGTSTLVSPSPNEWIFPKDELLVLSTDEQIEKIRPKLERGPGVEHRHKDLSEYELIPYLIQANSPLVNKRIRDAGIRDACGGMIVGIERKSQRLINPDSDLILEEGDLLLIVSEAGPTKKWLSRL